METTKLILQYSNLMHKMENEPMEAGYHVRDQEKGSSLLQRLTPAFAMACEVFRCGEKYFKECVSSLVIHEATWEKTSFQSTLVADHGYKK